MIVAVVEKINRNKKQLEINLLFLHIFYLILRDRDEIYKSLNLY